MNNFFTRYVTDCDNLFICVPEHLVTDIEVKILRVFTHLPMHFRMRIMTDPSDSIQNIDELYLNDQNGIKNITLVSHQNLRLFSLLCPDA